jgi:hypothetical protein
MISRLILAAVAACAFTLPAMAATKAKPKPVVHHMAMHGHTMKHAPAAPETTTDMLNDKALLAAQGKPQ